MGTDAGVTSDSVEPSRVWRPIFMMRDKFDLAKIGIRKRREEIKIVFARQRAILVAKLRWIYSRWIVQKIISFDISFIFVFLALKLAGYGWTKENLLASLGLWFMIKEIFKHVRGVATSFRFKG